MTESIAMQAQTAPPPVVFTKDEERAAYRDMLLIRRFEEKAGQMYGMGLIGGFCHLYIGQEAVVVGMQMALTPRRPGHHRLSRPWPHAGLRHGSQGRHGRADRAPRRLLQGQGRLDAHVQLEKKFYGGHGIVGAQVSLGTGIAFANRYRDNGKVSPDLFRRRRRQPGPGLRELQHGGAVEAAGGLHHREQPIRHGHRGDARLRADRFLQARPVLQHSRANRSTAWTCAPCKAAATRALEWCRDGNGPDHPRDA